MVTSKSFSFVSAKPVWEINKETEKNYSLVFRAVIEKEKDASLYIACHSRYQIFVNGQFIAAGPARAAHGFFRVDSYSLKKALTDKNNVVAIIAAGYNVNSFYLTDQPSFLCAEIISGDSILYATGSDKEFEAVQYTNRMQKVQRYSFQRPFTENYIYDCCYDFFIMHHDEGFKTVTLKTQDEKCFIERNVPYCEYRETKAKKIKAKGILIPDKKPRKYNDRSLCGINDKLKGFTEKQLMSSVVNELYAYNTQLLETEGYDMMPIKLGTNCCAIYDMGLNTSGFIRVSVVAEHDVSLYAVFNEILDDNSAPDPGRDGCANVVCWNLQGGRAYDLVSFEPYTYRYIQIISMYSSTLVTNVSQYRECYNESLLINKKAMPDETLQKIYDAATESFVQNATDIFMDCPSRERAGWLCDSYFTAKTEKALTGKNPVERNFLENFIQPDSFNNIPQGMLPMCYPADHCDGCYIPNWAMWYVIELEDYRLRSGDNELCLSAKNKVYELLEFFKGFENGDGLLQKLKSWVFVEWSKANSYVQDINYPTNMLYALCLESAGKLYNDESLIKKADTLRQTIREKSFDGKFFCDNAKLNADGKAERTQNRTETCQYYAFFSGTATKEAFPELYSTMLNDFGPSRNESNNKYPDIAFSNAFIGNYLRLKLLLSDGLYTELIKEIKSFFTPMAEKTGTLWENMSDSASCCHGFASYVAALLNEAI